MPGKLEAQTLETDEGRVVGRREQGLPEPSQLLPVAPGASVQVRLGLWGAEIRTPRILSKLFIYGLGE